MVGALGTVYGVSVRLLDDTELPAAFSARNNTVYDVPFVKEVIVNGLVAKPIDVYAPPFNE
jgi:hypothetical protein